MKAAIIIIFILPVFFIETKAADSSEDTWEDASGIFNKGFENQTPVTDSKLKQTIKMLEERSLSNKEKKLKQDVNPLSPASDFEHLRDFTMSQSPDEDLSHTLTVAIPARAYNDEGIVIPPGYYKLSCRKAANDKYVLDLSQGNNLMLTINAEQTNQDLEQETLTFCNAEIIDNDRIRLMYGSLELNLVGYIYFK